MIALIMNVYLSINGLSPKVFLKKLGNWAALVTPGPKVISDTIQGCFSIRSCYLHIGNHWAGLP